MEMVVEKVLSMLLVTHNEQLLIVSEEKSM